MKLLNHSVLFFLFQIIHLKLVIFFFHRGLTSGIKILSLLQIYRAFGEFVSLPWCFRRGLVHGHDWASPFKSSEPSLSHCQPAVWRWLDRKKGIISLFLLLL